MGFVAQFRNVGPWSNQYLSLASELRDSVGGLSPLSVRSVLTPDS